MKFSFFVLNIKIEKYLLVIENYYYGLMNRKMDSNECTAFAYAGPNFSAM